MKEFLSQGYTDFDVSSMECGDRMNNEHIASREKWSWQVHCYKNIFRLKTEIKLSADVITTVYTTTPVKKHGITMHVSDSVG